MKKLAVILCLFILIGSYKSYFLQRQEYEDNISAYLSFACRQCIISDFGPHVSLINLHSNRKNWIFNTKSQFRLNNDFISLSMEVKTIVYFPDLAPQEILCVATLPYGTYKAISKNTIINFKIIGPLYLPQNYKNDLWSNHYSFNLTIKQIGDFAPLSRLFHLEKPEYNIFHFYEKLLF